jgi:hypothetical protein
MGMVAAKRMAYGLLEHAVVWSRRNAAFERVLPLQRTASRTILKLILSGRCKAGRAPQSRVN